MIISIKTWQTGVLQANNLADSEVLAREDYGTSLGKSDLESCSMLENAGNRVCL